MPCEPVATPASTSCAVGDSQVTHLCCASRRFVSEPNRMGIHPAIANEDANAKPSVVNTFHTLLVGGAMLCRLVRCHRCVYRCGKMRKETLILKRDFFFAKVKQSLPVYCNKPPDVAGSSVVLSLFFFMAKSL